MGEGFISGMFSKMSIPVITRKSTPLRPADHRLTPLNQFDEEFEWDDVDDGDRERSRRHLGGSRYDGTFHSSLMSSHTGHRQRNHPGHLSVDSRSMTLGSDGFVDVPLE